LQQIPNVQILSRSYTSLLKEYTLDSPSTELRTFLSPDSAQFKQFASDTIQALDTAIDCYERRVGFLKLPDKLAEYVDKYCAIIEVCPMLARKGEETSMQTYANFSMHSILGSVYRHARVCNGRCENGRQVSASMDETVSSVRTVNHFECCTIVIVSPTTL